MKAILFDLDGTLLDSKDSNFRAFKEISERFGGKADFTVEKFKEWYTPNYFEFYKKLGIEEKYWEEASKLWRKFYISNENPGLFLDALEVLSYLKSRGFRLALVTGGSEERVGFELERKKIRSFFDVVVYGDKLKAEEVKPSPKQLLIALENLRLDAADAVYVGDTPTDVLAGKNAGMQTIAIVANPFAPIEKIEESRPDIIIDSLTELKKVY